MVMEGLQEDLGDGSMLCTDHPYKNSSSPGGICAFCLQEKLGKLVSSSFPAPIFPSSSSSSPPSFRSDFNAAASSSSSSTVALSIKPTSSSSSSINPITLTNHGTTTTTNDCRFHDQDFARRTRIPFLLTQTKKKKKELAVAGSSADQGNVVFKRSKSIATPRRRGGSVGDGGFLDGDMVEEFSPRRRRFWSFLYLKHSSNRRIDNKQSLSSSTLGASSSNGSFSQRSMRETKKREEFVAVDENESPREAAVERKVSRSRSVGCGSRSFSGDFFERISTGLGDCTLRRVESQREGKPKIESARRSAGYGGGRQDCIKERVKCGGIFGGFMITSSSSSSSSSSYLVSSSTEDNKATVATPAAAVGHLAHSRTKSWGWAFASPMRAFSKQSTTAKRDAHNKNTATTTATSTTTPNLNAIPSLLTVRS